MTDFGMLWPCKCRLDSTAQANVLGISFPFCYRCLGFVTGTIIFACIIVIYGKIFNADKSTLLLLSILCMLPSILHGGIYRRYYGKRTDNILEKILLFIEGIAATAGAYLFSLFLGQ